MENSNMTTKPQSTPSRESQERKAERHRLHNEIEGLPRIGWSLTVRPRSVQIITAPRTVWTYDKVWVGAHEDNPALDIPIYRTFVVPKDGNPALGRALDRKARKQRIAIALLVERARPEPGYRISSMPILRPDGTYVSVQGIGVILQSPSNFWDRLRRYDLDQIVHIKRDGTGLDTRFDIYAAEPRASVPTPDDGLIDLDTVIERLASPDRLQRFLDELQSPFSHHV